MLTTFGFNFEDQVNYLKICLSSGKKGEFYSRYQKILNSICGKFASGYINKISMNNELTISGELKIKGETISFEIPTPSVTEYKVVILKKDNYSITTDIYRMDKEIEDILSPKVTCTVDFGLGQFQMRVNPLITTDPEKLLKASIKEARKRKLIKESDNCPILNNLFEYLERPKYIRYIPDDATYVEVRNYQVKLN